MKSLYINTNSNDIVPGLFIQHDFSTIIAAKSIGKDCWINQQGTIGYSNKTDCPQLGDKLTINAGAKIIGGFKMGNNSTAGANAAVVKMYLIIVLLLECLLIIIRKMGLKSKKSYNRF